VTLVFPRFKYISGDPPLGIAYIAAYLKERLPDVEVSIIDTTFTKSLEVVRKNLDDISPDIVGIYLDTIMYRDGIRIARMAREKGAFVVAGGPHATMAHESVINYVDLIILGEGEKTFTRVVETFPDIEIESLKGVVCKRNGMTNFENKELDLTEDIDTIPVPDRDLLDMDKYANAWNYLDSVRMGTRGTTMITSRGCPYRCTFCQPTLESLFGKRLRVRSPENVVEEMVYLKDRYKIEGLFFHDDTFTVNRNWVMEFCDLVEEKKINILWGCNTRANTVDEELLKRMFEVGLRNIHLGIESGSQDILNDVYNKGITLDDVRRVVTFANRLHIRVLGFFMLGAPGESEDEINKTIRFATSLKLKEATFSITTPIPGTYLYDMVKKRGMHISDDFSDFDYYSKRAFSGDNLVLSRLKAIQKKALFSFYMHPFRWGYIARHLISPNGVKRLMRKVRRFA
jgi:radical SAM superfamily enzyme YgiQ (UPF0313 family)